MCGVFDIYIKNSRIEVSKKVIDKIIYGLKHRGSENWGLTIRDKEKKETRVYKGKYKPKLIDENYGKIKEFGVSTRYSTTGEDEEKNYTPAVLVKGNNLTGLEEVIRDEGGLVCLYNGEANTVEIVRELKKEGYEFESTNDTIHLTAYVDYQMLQGSSFIKAVNKTLTSVNGAYSIIFKKGNQTIAARGVNGTKPLEMLMSDDYVIFSSETQLFHKFDKQYYKKNMRKKYEGKEKVYNYENGWRKVYAGEIILLEDGKVIDCDTIGNESEKTTNVISREEKKKCLFEWYYFSNPGNYCFGADVQTWRGRNAKTLPRPYGRLKTWVNKLVRSVYVVPVPMSGNSGAHGYADHNGYKLREGIRISDYYKAMHNDRTFMQSSEELRDARLEDKYEFLPSVFKPKKYKGFKGKIKNVIKKIIPKKHVIVDDSIVRGRTVAYIITQALINGAQNVFFYSTAPPIKYGCWWGVDIKDESKILAHNKNIKEVNNWVLNEVKSRIEKEAPELLNLVNEKHIRVKYNRLKDSIKTADSFFSKKERGQYCTHCFNAGREDEVGVQKNAYEKSNKLKA